MYLENCLFFIFFLRLLRLLTWLKTTSMSFSLVFWSPPPKLQTSTWTGPRLCSLTTRLTRYRHLYSWEWDRTDPEYHTVFIRKISNTVVGVGRMSEVHIVLLLCRDSVFLWPCFYWTERSFTDQTDQACILCNLTMWYVVCGTCLQCLCARTGDIFVWILCYILHLLEILWMLFFFLVYKLSLKAIIFWNKKYIQVVSKGISWEWVSV